MASFTYDNEISLKVSMEDLPIAIAESGRDICTHLLREAADFEYRDQLSFCHWCKKYLFWCRILLQGVESSGACFSIK